MRRLKVPKANAGRCLRRVRILPIFRFAAEAPHRPPSLRVVVGDTGLELPQKTQGKREVAPSAAQNPAHSAHEIDLSALAKALAALPEADRRALAEALRKG